MSRPSGGVGKSNIYTYAYMHLYVVYTESEREKETKKEQQWTKINPTLLKIYMCTSVCIYRSVCECIHVHTHTKYMLIYTKKNSQTEIWN